MLRRIPVLVAGLTLLSAFVWAPHVHLHQAAGIRHAHLTPHEHGHPHESSSSDDERDEREDEDRDVLSADGFVAAAPGRLDTPLPCDVVTPTVAPALTLLGYSIAERPRSHAPPGGEPSASRAPPRSPAI